MKKEATMEKKDQQEQRRRETKNGSFGSVKKRRSKVKKGLKKKTKLQTETMDSILHPSPPDGAEELHPSAAPDVKVPTESTRPSHIESDGLGHHLQQAARNNVSY